MSTQAATLSAFPEPTIAPSGAVTASSLILPAIPGSSDALWFLTLTEWKQTGEVWVQAPVSSPLDDPGTPVPHNVFLTISNMSPDQWGRFELEVAGPATFSSTAPITINRPADPLEVTSTTIEFSGLSWSPASSSTITFGLDVTPPEGGEPLVLTLRPVAAVPEPNTGLLLAAGALLMRRTRRRA